MIVERVLSGCFFLLIIITNLASDRFGYGVFSDLDAESELKKISSSPKRFKISFILILAEHACIIALAATMCMAFSQYNMALAIVWTVFRSGEGLIQIYYKKEYRRMLGMATQYRETSGAERRTLIESGRNILKAKNTVFTYAQVLFSIGTMAYCIVFVAYEAMPAFIGWSGIVASAIYGSGSVIKLLKDDFKAVWNIGGLLILLFELVTGGWLIIHTLVSQ